MGTYRGWEHDLLAVAKLPDTQQNRAFLADWHSHADSDCDLNPIDLTHRITGKSKDCKPANIPYHLSAQFQAYSDRVWTRTAFSAQLKSRHFPYILAAFRTGDPYTVSDVYPLAKNLGKWGSKNFANYLIDLRFQGGPPPTLKAPQALRGWSDLQRSVNRALPHALTGSQHARSAALRELRRARRVRL